MCAHWICRGAPSDEQTQNLEVARAISGRYANIVTCHQCKHESITEENSDDIQLQPDVWSKAKYPQLGTALERYFAGEEIDGYRCEKCKTKGTITKSYSMMKAPRYLNIHISRHNHLNPRGKKNTKKLDFEPELRIPLKGNKGTAVFRLMSVIGHSGSTMSGGHYTAFVRQPNGEWGEADDHMVRCAFCQYYTAD